MFLLTAIRYLLNSAYSETGRYRSLGSITGFKKYEYIKCLAVSTRGIVACGGDDGMALYAMNNLKKKLSVPQHDIVSRGVVTTVAWLTGGGEALETLCFGTLYGWLIIWQQVPQDSRYAEICAERVGGSTEVISLAADFVDQENVRLAAGTREKTVQVWEVRQTRLISLFSVKIESVPKTIIFEGNTKHDLFVIGLYDGELIFLRGKDGRQQCTRSLKTNVGHAAISHKKGLLAIDCCMDSIRLFSSKGGSTADEFFTNTPVKRVPKQVAWAEQDSTLVVGSDIGVVYVFDVETGKQVDRIHHCKYSFVQVIATFETEETCVILCATSDGPGVPFVSLWVREKEVRSVRTRGRDSNSVKVGPLRGFAHMLWFAASKGIEMMVFLFKLALAVCAFVLILATISTYINIFISKDPYVMYSVPAATRANKVNGASEKGFLHSFAHSNAGAKQKRRSWAMEKMLGEL